MEWKGKYAKIIGYPDHFFPQVASKYPVCFCLSHIMEKNKFPFLALVVIIIISTFNS